MKLLALYCCLVHGQLISPYLVDLQPYSAVTIELNEGTVRGKRLKGVDVYRGIPYTKTAKRFQMSEAIEKFDGIVDGGSFGPTCYEIYPYWKLGNLESDVDFGLVSEDCLSVDIYVPNNNTNKDESGMGILFWIHGGSYTSGDSKTYSGIEQAVNHGNIVILVQYRLEVFGFLHYYDTDNNRIGGNYGLGDQALALKFAYNNAKNLGGDPDKLIINGESAGSACVMALLLHPPSVKYVAGAIAQSGSTWLNFGVTYGANVAARNDNLSKVCEQLEGCDHNNELPQIIEQLKTVNAHDLFLATTTMLWSPVPHDGVFFEESAQDRFWANDLHTDFKLFLGTNSYEESLLDGALDAFSGFETIMYVANAMSNFVESVALWNDVMGTNLTYYDLYKQIEAEFQAHEFIDEFGDEHYRFLVGQLASDLCFRYPAIVDAKKYTDAGVPVFYYYLDFDGKHYLEALLGRHVPFPGVAHGGELLYTFGAYKTIPNYAPWEEQLAEVLTTSFSTFINSKKDLWNRYSDNEAVLFVQNNKTHAIVGIEHGTAAVLRSKQAKDMWKRLAGKPELDSEKLNSCCCDYFCYISISIIAIVLTYYAHGKMCPKHEKES